MSVGLQTFNADGSIGLDSLSRPPRLIFFEMFDYDFTGTRYVPGFDDTKGFITANLGYHKYSRFALTQADNSDDLDQDVFMAFDAVSLPTLFWNNTTKVLDISPAAPKPNGDGGLAGGDGTDTAVPGKANFSIYMVMTQ